MTMVNVKFIDKEYMIPSDVVKYVDFVEFTNSIRDNLMRTFTRKIGNIEAIEDNNFMISDINAEVSRFISKLLENDIYDRTTNDYLKDNKGIDLFVETKKSALQQIISIRQEKLDVYKSGVEDAIYKKERSVTGLDFGILTSSFTNAMIYAYMDASEEAKQEKEALKVYNQEIAELDKTVQFYDEQERKFIINNFIPAMKTVFTFFSYELLDRFVADLIKANKFDQDALNHVDLERSNDLLKNLTLSNNKQTVLEKSFVACPFNVAVYMNAMKYDYLDIDTFRTAEYFKQSDSIIEFLEEQLGVAKYPKYTKHNYYSVVLLSKFTGKSVDEIVKQHTSAYANAVVNEYKKLVEIIENQNICDRIVCQWKDDDVLLGEAMSKRFVGTSVDKIVTNSTWKSLTEECGHSDLLNRIVSLVSNLEEISTKMEFDEYLRSRLAATLEPSRQKRAKEIVAKRERQEIQRQKEEEEKRKNRNKFLAICGLVVVVIIFLLSLPSIIESSKDNKIERAIKSELENYVAEFESDIESQIDDDVIIDYTYSMAYDWGDELVYDWDMIIRMNQLEEYHNAENKTEEMMSEIMDNCSVITDEFEAIHDNLSFEIEVKDTTVELDYTWGTARFSDISSDEIFFYDEYSFYRTLYSGDTEYTLDIVEEPEEAVEDNTLTQEEEETKENIARITSFLGRDVDDEGSVNLSDEDYEFITNDVRLFGADGYVESGTTDIGTEMSKIDIMDWTSNVKIEDFATLTDALEELYGTIYVVEEYYDYSDNAYMWKDIDIFSHVICWENSNHTVTIRWIVVLES